VVADSDSSRSLLAVSHDGIVHSIYEKNHVRHAIRTGDSWKEVSDPLYIVPTGLALDSIAIAHGDVVYFSYIEGVHRDLWVAKADPDAGTGWETSVIHTDRLEDSSIAIDRSGTVYVSYNDYADDVLRLAVRGPDAMAWRVSKVDELGESGGDTSLSVDETGRIHISYREGPSDTLKYATRPGDSEKWTIQTVDASGRVAHSSALAVAPDGKVHVLYYDAEASELKMASN
jgi:hypothetical protein